MENLSSINRNHNHHKPQLAVGNFVMVKKIGNLY